MKTFFVIAMVIFSAAFTGCARAGAADGNRPYEVVGDRLTLNDPAQLASLTIEPVEIRQGSFIQMTGRLMWNDDVTARVFAPLAGRVREIFVDIGKPVAKGQALALIDSPDFGQAKADARKAESDFVQTDRALSRMRDLFDHGAAAKKDVEGAEADFGRARAEKERALTRLANVGSIGAETAGAFTLRSPVAGVVVERNLSIGREVRPDELISAMPPMFVVTDPTKLWLQMDVAEKDLSSLHPGQIFKVYTQAYPTDLFPGTLNVITDALDPSTRTVKARGSVDNPTRALKAEMYVTVDVEKSAAPEMAISKRAVFVKEGKYFVFVDEGKGRFARHEVQIAGEHAGKINVTGGLMAGHRLVTDGSLLLQQLLEYAGK
jgi:cobalt-zinc-cadmium efflux system membrane fusion protein